VSTTMEDGDLRSHGHEIFDDMLRLALLHKYRGDGLDAVVAYYFRVLKCILTDLELITFDVCARLIPNKNVVNS